MAGSSLLGGLAVAWLRGPTALSRWRQRRPFRTPLGDALDQPVCAHIDSEAFARLVEEGQALRREYDRRSAPMRCGFDDTERSQ